MRWYQPAVNSIRSILGRPDPTPTAGMVLGMEDVRDCMLGMLFQAGVERSHPDLVAKISFAGAVETLWYARCEVMAALSEVQGEARAQQQLIGVSEMFRGLLPEARAYRPRGGQH